ncbi:MAG: autotransporter-associated beta strand repeat-containing protein, partial [Luteolibacter sp.]
MKNFRQITIGLVSCMVLPIQAETYHWDGSADVTLGSSDNAETTAQDWLSGGLWDDGSSSQSLASWVAGDSAIFGGSAASQTINAGTITIGDMTFGAGADGSGTSGTAYTIAGGTLTLSNSTVTTNTDTTISSSLDGSSSLIKAGAGILTFNNQKTYSGGTTVDAGLLDLTGGGGSGGTIRGTVDVNSGATLRISTGDATGYGTGSDRLATINLNGGTLNVNSVSNQTLGNATINMTGASITGIGGSNIDFFQGSSALNSLASATTSNISGASLQIRQGSGLTIDVADGDAATDLQINSIVKSHGSFTTAPLIKAGAGTLSLTAANTYSGATVVNAGTLKISNTLRSTSSLTANNGATLELGAINMFVG